MPVLTVVLGSTLTYHPIVDTSGGGGVRSRLRNKTRGWRYVKWAKKWRKQSDVRAKVSHSSVIIEKHCLNEIIWLYVSSFLYSSTKQLHVTNIVARFFQQCITCNMILCKDVSQDKNASWQQRLLHERPRWLKIPLDRFRSLFPICHFAIYFVLGYGFAEVTQVPANYAHVHTMLHYVVVKYQRVYLYPSWLLRWHWSKYTIVPVPLSNVPDGYGLTILDFLYTWKENTVCEMVYFIDVISIALPWQILHPW